MDCITCEKSYVNGEKFCAVCGGRLEDTVPFCDKCKITFHGGEKFCTNCGKEITSTYPLVNYVNKPTKIEINTTQSESDDSVKINKNDSNFTPINVPIEQSTNYSSTTNAEQYSIFTFISGILSMLFYPFGIFQAAGITFFIIAWNMKPKKHAWAMYIGLILIIIYSVMFLIGAYACIDYYCENPFDIPNAIDSLK